jgi:hypothetical protein
MIEFEKILSKNQTSELMKTLAFNLVVSRNRQFATSRTLRELQRALPLLALTRPLHTPSDLGRTVFNAGRRICNASRHRSTRASSRSLQSLANSAA